MRVRHATEADAGAIEAFLAQHPDATPFHTSRWIDAVSASCGHKLYLLLVGEPLQGLLPLHAVKSRLFGNALVSTGFAVSGGILALNQQAVDALGEAAWALAKERGCTTVELRGGALPTGWQPREGIYAGYRRDLASDDDAELLAIPRKQRAEVRKALANDLTVDLGDDRAHYAVYAESVRNLGTPVFPKRLFDAVRARFGDHAEILTVRKDGVPLASVLSLYWRGVVMPYWGGGTAAARPWRANDMMYFALMRRARERGARRFDFGRSKVGTGAAAFKHNWGFEAEPLSYVMRSTGAARSINPLDARYSRKVELWKRMPLAVANRLGPWIARDLA